MPISPDECPKYSPKTMAMSDIDHSDSLREAVLRAGDQKTPLDIQGGGSKRFYGREPQGESLDVTGYRGVVSYEPSELVITARAGTPLAEIRATLTERGQMLGFEPPSFGGHATLGGAVACGLSGPRRPYTGSARDLVLGIKLLNGKGEILSFGGQVMKNVAGYDVSRLMTGALGTLGVILEVSLKILPRPALETTLVQQRPVDQAIESMNRWAGRPLPISATCHDGDALYIRLSGAAPAVEKAAEQLGGERQEGESFWAGLREQSHGFFANGMPLWRLSLPAAAPMPRLPGNWLLEWGGAQRWLRSVAPVEDIRKAALEVGGHATLFRGGDRHGQVFQPLDPVLLRLHRNLKQAFDPWRIFNPGRMYPEF